MTTRRRDLSNVRVRPRAVQPERGLRLSGEGAVTTLGQRASGLAAALKRALHASIHGSTQPLTAIAQQSGISYPFLANSALPSSTDQLPFARLPLVLAACDDLSLVRFLADLQACDVLVRPTGRPTADDIRRAAAAMRAFAEFTDAAAQALEDRTIQPAEFARVERDGLQAIDAIRQLLADYRARVTRPLLEDLR